MLKKRILCGILAVLLSFLCCTAYAFDFKGLFGQKKTETENVAATSLKVYMPSEAIEPSGGVTAGKLKSAKGAEDAALRLYDGDEKTAIGLDRDAEITLDIGVVVLLSQIRYCTGKEDKDKNNCLGTRFYASVDNKKYVELGVIQSDSYSEDAWNEINFSGFGEYRYLRVSVPAYANLTEIQWMGVSGFSKIKQPNGKYTVKLGLCGFDAAREMKTTIIASVHGESGVMKQISLSEQGFMPNMPNMFEVQIKDVDAADGDNYKISIFNENGSQPIPHALSYRVNGAASQFSVSSVFSDNMILQADKPVTVWGRAPKYREVEVCLKNDLGGSVKNVAVVGENSEWSADMGTFSQGGSYTLSVRCDGIKNEYKNITFGDVWLCTGQSNMDYYMAAGDETKRDLENAEAVRNDEIRLLNLWNKGIDGAAAPVDEPPAGVEWQRMNADVAAYCSAVGYYFAQEIQRTANTPIGIINAAVGDTEINRWIPKGEKCGVFTSTDGDLYNNRIRPFEKLQIKGIILYQGEADQYRTHMSAEEYSDAMAGLVDIYRESWGEALPFYWTQLTRYRVDETLVRQGQLMALDKVKVKDNTGMIVLNDIVGSYDGKTGSCREDIHPWGKKTVAERFAAYAKRDCYDKNVPVSGPVPKGVSSKNGALVLEFECEGKLRVMPRERYADKITVNRIEKEKIDTSKPREFEVAGSDKVYYPANAELDGKKVILRSGEVSAPKYARYAWGAYPEMPNLTDDTGLPTATFSTEYD